jgi:single-stranded DNA-binding protein
LTWTRTEDTKTVRTTIVAFDKRAEAPKDSVAKGQQVQVVGYEHVTDRKMNDGSTKQVKE